MAKIIEFKPKQLEKRHLEGPAKCIGCQHTWQADVEAGTIWIECPSCGLEKGVFAVPFIGPSTLRVCNCGNDLFYVGLDGHFCANCGEKQAY